jgi:hypothetical protein
MKPKIGAVSPKDQAVGKNAKAEKETKTEN